MLSESYNPRYRAAVVLLHRLETPGYYNRTIGPNFRGKVEEVKKLLLEAEGFYDSGRYDLAFKRCEQVLNIDRYNIAARKMQEKINLARDNYAIASLHRDAFPARCGNSIRRGPCRCASSDSGRGYRHHPGSSGRRGTARINAKLQRIILPKLEFREATIREAVEFLKQEERRTRHDGNRIRRRKGVNIVLKARCRAPEAVPRRLRLRPRLPAIPGLNRIPGSRADAGCRSTRCGSRSQSSRCANHDFADEHPAGRSAPLRHLDSRT